MVGRRVIFQQHPGDYTEPVTKLTAFKISQEIFPEDRIHLGNQMPLSERKVKDKVECSGFLKGFLFKMNKHILVLHF